MTNGIGEVKLIWILSILGHALTFLSAMLAASALLGGAYYWRKYRRNRGLDRAEALADQVSGWVAGWVVWGERGAACMCALLPCVTCRPPGCCVCLPGCCRCGW